MGRQEVRRVARYDKEVLLFFWTSTKEYSKPFNHNLPMEMEFLYRMVLGTTNKSGEGGVSDRRNKCRNCTWYVTKNQTTKNTTGCGWCHGDCPGAQLTTSPPENQPPQWANWPLVTGNEIGCRQYMPKRT